MKFRDIHPGKIAGKLELPSSKSLTHRLFLMAALGRRPVTVSKPLISEDAEITLTAIRKLGFDAEDHGHKVVFSGNYQQPVDTVNILVENSGTSARLLTGFAAIQPVISAFDGSERMRERPMGELLDALQTLGIHSESQNGYMPFRLRGGTINKAHVTIDASKSSQFLSALLIIAPYTGQGLTITHNGNVASRPYVDMTVALMKRAGIELHSFDDRFEVPGGQRYHLSDTTVEGDYSSASYWLTAAAMTGTAFTITNLSPQSVQGDRVILDILADAGADVSWNNEEVTVRGTETIRPLDWDMHNSPDLVPTVAMLALFADGISRFRNISHLRYKECDRLQAIIDNVAIMGGKAWAEDDDLLIEPTPLNGGQIKTYNDHRMAMCFSLAGLRVPGISIENPDCVRKSYPQYWQHFDQFFVSL